MNRRTTRLEEIFNIEVSSPVASTSAAYTMDSRGSTPPPTNDLSGSRIPLTPTGGLPDNFNGDNFNFVRSYSVDHDMNSSGITGAPSRSRGNVRRWSQTLFRGAKNGKQTVRQKTINFMPSRMQGAYSIDGQHLISHDTEIEQLTQEIEQHDHLMDDTAFSEQLRIETLRALPQSLTVKRQIKEKLSAAMTVKSQQRPIGEMKRLKYKFGMWINRTKFSTTNTVNNMELWYTSMKKIEGHFGSAVGTYFKFLRWLFSLNLLLLLMIAGFIILPQILLNNVAGANTSIINVPFQVEEIFTAKGYFRQSILFYGAYSNDSFSLDTRNTYSMPYAYFMTMIVLYVVTFIIVSISMARSYRRSFIETAGGVPNLYALKIFCSWDFSITNRKAAQLKHMSIFNELQEVLNDIHHQPVKPSRLQAFWTFCTQLTAHILVVCMLAGIGLGMWSLLQIIDDAMPSADVVNVHSAIAALYVAIMVNGTMLVMHVVLAWIATMEDYKSTRLSLHITLVRNYLLELVIVGVLMVFWLTKGSTECWETSMGQEVYRLVVVDFVVFVLGGAILHLLRFLTFRYLWEKVGLPEFDISRGSLGLIFNQTLLWVGLLFSPPLVGIITIKMMITFYLKKTTLIYFCKPPSRLWRSAQTSTLFLVMVFVSLLGVVIAHGYIITQVKVSDTCGPFQGHDYMFQIFFESMLKLREEHWTWRIVVAFTKPAVIGGILLSMCVVAYYLRSKSIARIGMVKILNEMLYLEAKDKEFLLSNITRITQGKDWLFDNSSNFDGTRSQDIYAESSSTWNYRDDTAEDKHTDSSASNYNRLHADIDDVDDLSISDPPSIRNRRF